MPLVAAKCTQCGANLQVNSENECSICSACGTPFITEKAITNYNTTINNTYNIDNKTIVSGNAEVHIHNDEINKLFLIEEGELTRYKGKRSKVTVPEGVLGIGDDILPDSIASLDKITLPSTLKYLEKTSLNHCKHVVFHEDCKLEEIGAGALGYLVRIIENFPLTVKKWHGFGSSYAPNYPIELIICCRYSKEEFIKAYGEDKMHYIINDKQAGQINSKYTFVFDFEKIVEKGGFTFAVSKNSATIIDYSGNEPIKIFPSYIEGKPVTQITQSIAKKHNPEELHLPEKLEEIPDFSQINAKKVFIPSCVKRIGRTAILSFDGEVVFENGYCEVEEIGVNGVYGVCQNVVYTPYLKKNGITPNTYFSSPDFIIEKITAQEAKARTEKYNSEKYQLTITNQATHKYATIYVQRNDNKYKVGDMDARKTTFTLKVHPTEKVFVSISGLEQEVLKGAKTCIIKSGVFSPWTLKCKK